ncbi:MAG: cytochrome c oxidase assembly protein [Pseudomonadota bacterium]|nr:cytochrome c oxidase assembly protein [Pseudomonadota bacterium]
MNETRQSADERIAEARRKGRFVAAGCAAFALGMVGAAYASVPLYQLFCQVTGYGGTTQRADAAPVEVVDIPVKIRFDGNVAKGLPWRFTPNDREVTVKLGEVGQTSYHVTNLSDRPTKAQALFNVTPDAAGLYFNKIACFCFNEQLLQPGETVDMGITFFVDPDIREAEELKLDQAITLSYTFFPVEDETDETLAEAPNTDEAGAGSKLEQKTSG